MKLQQKDSAIVKPCIRIADRTPSLAWLTCFMFVIGTHAVADDVASRPPNLVVVMADDWSWPHAGILGDPVVATPNFDRVAREGVLFENAFVSTPSCTPSRLSVLTGQHHWRLKEGDSLGGSLRESYPVYTELLQSEGYLIGRYGKGVWPSEHKFRNRDSFGPKFPSLRKFLQQREPGQPFCYWHGGQDPHRPYEWNVGAGSGIDLEKIEVPACLPDDPTVRGDVADYLWEVQRFDRQVGTLIATLRSVDELENTIFVVTSDNGMPFPRCKATLYDQGTRVPLAIRWGAKVDPGRRVADFVSLCDLAPTFLRAADVAPPSRMTGNSLLPLLRSKRSGQIDPARTFTLSGMERHVYAYPSRSLRTNDFRYLRNFEPDDWPTGQVAGHNPSYDFTEEPWPTETGAFSFNVDPSPTKQLLRLHRERLDINRFAKLAFDRRPAEELYDLHKDPQQLNNVAGRHSYSAELQRYRRKLNAELIKSSDPRVKITDYSDRKVEGWPVRVSHRLLSEKPEQTKAALKLLRGQLRQIVARVPESCLQHLRDVPIWMSPTYEGFRPSAEYHPSANWLRKEGRHEELAKCVELTNIDIFPRECRRMPMMILHELAHAYHDQVLGFDHRRLKEIYAKTNQSGKYESVQRKGGTTERAYGMTDHKEYFAESSESFFGTNDFFPFNRQQLYRHDPEMHDLLAKLWQVEDSPSGTTDVSRYVVDTPPDDLHLDPFYGKYVQASGYPIVSSSKVDDYALKEAAYLVDMMLAERPDIRQAMIASGSRMIVMAHNEYTTDVPEHSHLKPKDYMDARARGLGGSRTDPVCSVAEENLLGFPGDPYSTENILIHEFAHNIHLRGMVNVDPTFDDRLKACYRQAMADGLWKGKYASTNHAEYFAEGVQSWFNNNRQPDHDHNHVDTREELRQYDPGLAKICESVFGSTELVYTKPATRLTGHLDGYDPSSAPTFRWPTRLIKAKQQIREEVNKRGENRQAE